MGAKHILYVNPSKATAKEGVKDSNSNPPLCSKYARQWQQGAR